jgi:UDP-3-O-[3-hydroxymyristoyl] glucosamine N-acyltransferase
MTPDPRFYEPLGPASLGEIAALAKADLVRGGAAGRIESVAPLALAGPEAVSFLAGRRYAEALSSTRAGAVFVRRDQADAAPQACAVLVAAAPQIAYARAAERLHRPRRLDPDQPAVHPNAELEEGVVLSPGAVVGAGARIGRGTVVGAHAVIGPGVCIGRDGRIGAGASIGFALIGDRVRILSGAVIGEEGFGVGVDGEGAVDLPQLGRVILQDGVSVGANTCIDRGAYDDTVVGENSKIDNLVQVAHNVRIGRNCVLAAHTGISGSTVIGDGAMFGGRAGAFDHVRIGARARIGAAAAVMTDVPDGETWTGYPARPMRRALREAAWLARMAARRIGARHEES